MAFVDVDQQKERLDDAFERIEDTILPCIAMMLETLLDASAGAAQADPKALAAELQTLAAELEELTQAVERSSPPCHPKACPDFRGVHAIHLHRIVCAGRSLERTLDAQPVCRGTRVGDDALACDRKLK